MDNKTAYRTISKERLHHLSESQKARLLELEPKMKAVTRADFAKMTSKERAAHLPAVNEYEALLGISTHVVDIGQGASNG